MGSYQSPSPSLLAPRPAADGFTSRKSISADRGQWSIHPSRVSGSQHSCQLPPDDTFEDDKAKPHTRATVVAGVEGILGHWERPAPPAFIAKILLLALTMPMPRPQMGISFSTQSVRVWWWTFSMLYSIPTSSPSLTIPEGQYLVPAQRAARFLDDQVGTSGYAIPCMSRQGESGRQNTHGVGVRYFIGQQR